MTRRTGNDSGVVRPSVSTTRASEFSGVIKVKLQEQAALVAAEWPVIDMRRAAGIRHWPKGLAADRQRAGKLENLFPILVIKRLRREHTRLEPEQSGPRSATI